MNKIAEKKGTNVANLMDDLFNSAGQGTETIKAEDMQIPFMRLLQAMSPQLDKNEASYIKGASQGDIFNTVTGQYWEGEQGVVVLPCAFTTKFLEFQLRDTGGGFLGELDPSDQNITQTTRNGSVELLPSGNELVRSYQFLVLAVGDDGVTQQMICDMKKTQVKVAKQWNTRRAGLKIKHPTKGLFNPPMWAQPWRLTSVQQSNDQGKWFNYQLNQDVLPIDSVPVSAQEEAKELYNRFKSGEIKTGTGEETPSSNMKDEDLPF